MLLLYRSQPAIRGTGEAGRCGRLTFDLRPGTCGRHVARPASISVPSVNTARKLTHLHR